jgi:catechol 2,3-dioxygenase-like lactoylglutathione lyase family enzyme
MRGFVLFVAGMLVGTAVQAGRAQSAPSNPSAIVGMNHVGVAAANLEDTVAFYTQKMGFKEAFRTRNEQGQTQLVFIQTNRNTFIELAQATAQRPAGFTHVGIHVENMPEAVRLYQSRGLTVTEPRLSVPVGSTQASITDPNGLRVELTELPPASLQRKAMDAWR